MKLKFKHPYTEIEKYIIDLWQISKTATLSLEVRNRLPYCHKELQKKYNLTWKQAMHLMEDFLAPKYIK